MPMYDSSLSFHVCSIPDDVRAVFASSRFPAITKLIASSVAGVSAICGSISSRTSSGRSASLVAISRAAQPTEDQALLLSQAMRDMRAEPKDIQATGREAAHY